MEVHHQMVMDQRRNMLRRHHRHHYQHYYYSHSILQAAAAMLTIQQVVYECHEHEVASNLSLVHDSLYYVLCRYIVEHDCPFSDSNSNRWTSIQITYKQEQVDLAMIIISTRTEVIVTSNDLGKSCWSYHLICVGVAAGLFCIVFDYCSCNSVWLISWMS
jgi:hypothetical protein